MRGSARLVGLMLAAPVLLSSCDLLLGIEERTFDTTAGPCTTTRDCRATVGDGFFCVAGVCGTQLPENDACQLLEPQETLVLNAYDWQTNKPIILGGMFRLFNSSEEPRLDATRLAVREINENGGLGAGRKLAMVACDYGGQDGTLDGASDNTLLSQGIDFLGRDLGAAATLSAASSSSTQRIIERIVAQRYPMAFISSFSTSTQLTNFADRLESTDPYGLLWRTAPNDAGQAQVMAQLIGAQTGLSKLATVYINDAYGIPLQQGVKQALSDLGSTIDTKDVYPFDVGDDLNNLVTTVAATAPDGLLVIAVGGDAVIDIYTALVNTGSSGTINHHFLMDGAKDAQALLDGSAPPEVRAIVSSALGTAPFHSIEPNYDTFAVNLQNEFGAKYQQPLADSFSFLAQSYDAAYMSAYGLAFADARSGPAADGHVVVEGFSRLVRGEVVRIGSTTWSSAFAQLTTGDDAERQIDMAGTSGPLDFDVDSGDTVGPMEIWRANGVFNSFVTCAVCQPGDSMCDLSGCN